MSRPLFAAQREVAVLCDENQLSTYRILMHHSLHSGTAAYLHSIKEFLQASNGETGRDFNLYVFGELEGIDHRRYQGLIDDLLEKEPSTSVLFYTSFPEHLMGYECSEDQVKIIKKISPQSSGFKEHCRQFSKTLDEMPILAGNPERYI
jgi:hypothetical protein